MEIQNITFCGIKCKSPALGVFKDAVEDILKALWLERNNTDVSSAKVGLELGILNTPIFGLSSCIFSIRSLMYTRYRTVESTPPCLTP